MLSETEHDHATSASHTDHRMSSAPEPLNGGKAPDIHENGDRNEQAGVTTSQVKCTVCGSTFRRPEHLKRHLRSHTKEKPFESSIDADARNGHTSDTLHRHELSHHTPGGEGGKDRPHRITVKTFRACFSCATARVRCSGGVPCGRCETRSLECHYPTERRSKARLRGVKTKRAPEGPHLSRKSPPRSEAKQAESTARPADIPAHQLGQFSINVLNDVPASSKRRAQRIPGSDKAPTAKVSSHESSNQPHMAGSVYSHMLAPPLTSAAEPGRIPLNMHSRAGLSNYEAFAGPEAATGGSVNNFNPSDSTFGPEVMAMNVANSSGLNLGFDPTIFNQSTLHTINWLPTELFPDHSSDQTLAPVIQHQPLNDAPNQTPAARPIWQPAVIEEKNTSLSTTVRKMHRALNSVSSRVGMASPRRRSFIDGKSAMGNDPTKVTKRTQGFRTDSVGGWPPRIRKHQKRSSSASVELSVSAASLLFEQRPNPVCFPKKADSSFKRVPEDLYRQIRPIKASTYDKVHENFISLCRNTHTIFEIFDTDDFPEPEECTRYLFSYLSSFQPVYPIFHIPTFDVNEHHWVLVLAILAIGCQSSKTANCDQTSAAFHEMLRRAILVEKEKGSTRRASLDMLQAMLLSCLGILYSGDDRNKLSTLGVFKELVRLFEDEELLADSKYLQSSEQLSGEALWHSWINDEIRRRTGYCIWLVDCSLAYEIEERPLLSLDDGQAALPANEELWHCESAEAWKLSWDQSTANQSLYDSVHILYIEKRLVTGLGDFSYTLLIHALYHRMWEVGDYFRRPLSFWNPTARKQSRETAIPNGSVWLPGIPSYSKWRNSACDCLEILHWTVNAPVADLSKHKRPVSLHLHTARLILLAPFREIRSLVMDLATDRLRWSDRQQAIQWQYIWRWIKYDQYKARISVLHAGAALWHVQKCSKNAFHEPIAAFLAILVLWAYGSCPPMTPTEPGPHLQSHKDASFPESRSVRLDRPFDDEQAQFFVREGHSMKVGMTGIPNLCAADGPERMLRLGSEVLSNLDAWGQSKRFVAILTRLASIVSQGAQAEHSRHGNMED
ncbi:hypothetical protein POX_d05311 [Penicillium oxalicum]|uniref:hypothetical protein n=1 Tax=Penicillium oxalicum TaxID=69781 RepID=UPI0020B72B05|nr:hypothetical protein POX_d05311 [Penicillium oxalicum]KAI2789813.1 hypothetical protein POX_d05311 [Penicillium oxalicum]